MMAFKVMDGHCVRRRSGQVKQELRMRCEPVLNSIQFPRQVEFCRMLLVWNNVRSIKYLSKLSGMPVMSKPSYTIHWRIPRRLTNPKSNRVMQRLMSLTPVTWRVPPASCPVMPITRKAGCRDDISRRICERWHATSDKARAYGHYCKLRDRKFVVIASNWWKEHLSPRLTLNGASTQGACYDVTMLRQLRKLSKLRHLRDRSYW